MPRMLNINDPDDNRPRSFSLSPSLARMSAKIVQSAVAGIVASELERRYEQLLPELRKEVEAILDRELSKRVEAIIGRELSRRIEAAIDRTRRASSEANDRVLRDRFTRVFYQNLWGDSESVSGPGSRRDSDSVLLAIRALKLAKENVDFMSISDIPCGDFNWMETFLRAVPEVRYRGFDIVPALIERNRILHSDYEFDVLDITAAPPPSADLIFSKDLLNHLTYDDIRAALINMQRSNSMYLLVTNNFGHPNTELSENLGNSSRYFDLCDKPFNFPAPIWRDDYIGLWRSSDISL
jgi:hypothetical protein